MGAKKPEYFVEHAAAGLTDWTFMIKLDKASFE